MSERNMEAETEANRILDNEDSIEFIGDTILSMAQMKNKAMPPLKSTTRYALNKMSRIGLLQNNMTENQKKAMPLEFGVWFTLTHLSRKDPYSLLADSKDPDFSLWQAAIGVLPDVIIRNAHVAIEAKNYAPHHRITKAMVKTEVLPRFPPNWTKVLVVPKIEKIDYEAKKLLTKNRVIIVEAGKAQATHETPITFIPYLKQAFITILSKLGLLRTRYLGGYSIFKEEPSRSISYLPVTPVRTPSHVCYPSLFGLPPPHSDMG